MNIKQVINKKYILYGSSIVLTRGLEMLVLFYASYHLSKQDYGGLEFYKKLIEVVSTLFAFGFPALILSYTKNKNSKIYLYFFSLFFVLMLSVVSIPFLHYFNYLFLLIPFIFYALFFTGGITQSYFLVLRGSDWTSFYKIGISVLFYTAVFVLISNFGITDMAYVYPSYILTPFLSAWIFYEYKHQKISFYILKKYTRLFKKLLWSSFTLVASTFTNMMFLYTDIFVLKLLSETPNVEIANYSFALNISNVLLLIPYTLIQVDIEKLKKSVNVLFELHKKIWILLLLAALLLVVSYKFILLHFFVKYADTFMLFTLILAAKFIQALGPLFGTYILIKKKFNTNLKINIFVLILNIFLSYYLYLQIGIYGVAIASIFSLLVRYLAFIILLRRNNYYA